ncbi:MAG TPA: hypothetical protein VE988_12405 [Gemmataceae bacterium]|nr:hypothetical protein [Gemmataceae bacterium]
MPKKSSRRADFDSPWKEALDYFLPAFLAFFYAEAHAGIDWSKGYESLDKELHQIARGARSGKSLADKLFKVWLLGGKEAWLLIHIEVQGEPEEDFPLRMFRYNTRAFDRYNRTVVSLAVLTDERADWRPEKYEYGAWGAVTGIHFLTAKLLDWRGREPELETSANPCARVVLAHLAALQTRQDPITRGRYKLQLVKGLYHHGWTAEDVRQLFRVIDWLLDLPWELQQGFQEDLHNWEEEKRMPYVTSVERYGMEKGLQQGRQEGRQEGLAEGLLEGIAAALASKFASAGKRLMTKIRPIQDVEELRALLNAIPTAQSLQEIRDRLVGRQS